VVQIIYRLQIPAPFPFPSPLIEGAGKTGKPGIPENPEIGKIGKIGKNCERIEALAAQLVKVSRLAGACLRRLSPADRAAAFAECRCEA
jgi:hypothetical protein